MQKADENTDSSWDDRSELCLMKVSIFGRREAFPFLGMIRYKDALTAAHVFYFESLMNIKCNSPPCSYFCICRYMESRHWSRVICLPKMLIFVLELMASWQLLKMFFCLEKWQKMSSQGKTCLTAVNYLHSSYKLSHGWCLKVFAFYFFYEDFAFWTLTVQLIRLI